MKKIKIDIISGFLGAGKTTLIKKLLGENAFAGEKVVLIENEFGEVNIDSVFIGEVGMNIKEISSGCICCSLISEFKTSLQVIVEQFAPDRILIEPTGVARTGDMLKAISSAELDCLEINTITSIVSGDCCVDFMEGYGDFYNDQIKNASCILISHFDELDDEEKAEVMSLVREQNPISPIITSSWDDLSGIDILMSMQGDIPMLNMVEEVTKEHHEHCDCGHEHHAHHEHCDCGHEHHEHHEHCDCGHEHHAHHEHCDCGHEHHGHHEHCDCGHEHHGHHEHCDCGHEHHGHHEHCDCGHEHHEHESSPFVSVGFETVRKYSFEELESMLSELSDSDTYGTVLRAKAVVEGVDSKWINFDYTTKVVDIRAGKSAITGMICVIGCDIKEDKLATLFKVNNVYGKSDENVKD